jgi:hypothetical protein
VVATAQTGDHQGNLERKTQDVRPLRIALAAQPLLYGARFLDAPDYGDGRRAKQVSKLMDDLRHRHGHDFVVRFRRREDSLEIGIRQRLSPQLVQELYPTNHILESLGNHS